MTITLFPKVRHQQWNKKQNANKKINETLKDKSSEGYDGQYMNLSTVRATQEIKNRLGADWFHELEDTHQNNDITQKSMNQYSDALFMSLWNKVNKEYNDLKVGSIAHTGAKLKIMIKIWLEKYDKIEEKVIHI